MTPLNCPICSRPNACARETSGGLDTRCWCEQADFSAAALARVPANLRGVACICASCAAAGGLPASRGGAIVAETAFNQATRHRR